MWYTCSLLACFLDIIEPLIQWVVTKACSNKMTLEIGIYLNVHSSVTWRLSMGGSRIFFFGGGALEKNGKILKKLKKIDKILKKLEKILKKIRKKWSKFCPFFSIFQDFFQFFPDFVQFFPNFFKIFPFFSNGPPPQKNPRSTPANGLFLGQWRAQKLFWGLLINYSCSWTIFIFYVFFNST